LDLVAFLAKTKYPVARVGLPLRLDLVAFLTRRFSKERGVVPPLTRLACHRIKGGLWSAFFALLARYDGRKDTVGGEIEKEATRR
jgi:hypothetical protein